MLISKKLLVHYSLHISIVAQYQIDMYVEKGSEISLATLPIFVLQLYERSPLKFQPIVFHPIEIMWFLGYHIIVCSQTP